MQEIMNDAFYDYIKQYDSDREYHFVGEVDYHLLEDDKPYESLQSHKDALIVVFDHLVENSIENRKKARERYGDDIADKLFPLVYDINKAQSTCLNPDEFFYCPNIVKTDYYGNVRYDAEWKPNDDNFGTTVPYWYALMEPVHGRNNKPEDFKKVNEVLFPNGTDCRFVKHIVQRSVGIVVSNLWGKASEEVS